MATIFKGMSKDNFLDDLVQRTGLNGHDLHEYLVSLLPKEEEKKNTDHYPTQEIARFYGDRFAAVLYLEGLGADESAVKLFKASSYEFRAAQLAAAARVKRFEWTCPITILRPNGEQDTQDRTFVGFWNAEKEIYEFY